MTFLPGTMFAGFTIERMLGSGGMSEVYLVHRARDSARQTFKVLNLEASGDPGLRLRFEKEAELASRLHHPNIVSVHDHGEFEGQLWMSMHYVEGYSAARLVARGQIALNAGRAARIISEVAKGLDYAHGQGIIHRDVKPSNILISTIAQPGQYEQVLLSDWGIARLLDDDSPLARNGTVFASIHYAAPELLQGGTLTAQTDVYALTCTLVELLTGKPPYPAATTLGIVNAHLHSAPPSVVKRRPALPDALDGVVARGLAKKSADRFPTCQDLSSAVLQALGTAVSTRPPSEISEQIREQLRARGPFGNSRLSSLMRRTRR